MRPKEERRAPVVGYDGSESARGAIEQAGDPFGCRPALVLYAYEAFELSALCCGAIGMSATVAEDTAAIVLGSPGLSGLRSLMLGSVSDKVVQHARRPVLVVPSGALAYTRREFSARHDDRATGLAQRSAASPTKRNRPGSCGTPALSRTP